MPTQAHSTCAIGVMAKAPQAGRSKTRLCPPLTPAQAAAMSAAFLRDTTENMAAAARQAAIVPYAAYAPLGTESLVRTCLAEGTELLLADGSPRMPEGVTGFGRCPAACDPGHARGGPCCRLRAQRRQPHDPDRLPRPSRHACCWRPATAPCSARPMTAAITFSD